MQAHKKYSITVEELSVLLRYDASEGAFYWTDKVTSNNAIIARDAGKQAGSMSNGYREISFGTGKNRVRYRVHTLVWLFETGRRPERSLDHINGIRHDNRFCNLREATPSENCQNVSATGRGVTGLLGVTYCPQKRENGKLVILKRPYRAEIRVDGRRHSLGYYDTAEAAHAAYLDGKRKYHPFNARIDIPDDLVAPAKFVVPYRNGGTVDYLCGHCGVTSPELFYDYHTRSTCRKCLAKRQMAAKPVKYKKPKYVCMHCGNADREDFYSSYQTACKPCVRLRTKQRRDAGTVDK